MDVLHLSRHFLRLQASHVASLPGPPPGPPDAEGVITAHKLFAVGAWVEDVQEEHLAVMGLTVRSSQGAMLDATPQRLASWRHPGRVTALQVADYGGGEIAIFSGGATGAVCRLSLAVPLAPGAGPQDIQLRAGGFEGADLLPWAQLHAGPVTGLSVQHDTGELATCGLDGRVFLLPATAEAGAAPPQPFADCGRSTSFWALAWSSPQTLVTAGTTGGLEVWEKRSPGQPVARSPLSWGAAGCAAADAAQGRVRRIHSLAVHPAQPHLAASGASDGGLAIWDLRFDAGSPPQQAALDQSHVGAVLKVEFDASDAASGAAAAEPRLLFCTQGGFLGAAAPASGPHPPQPQQNGFSGSSLGRSQDAVAPAWQAEVLYREDAAILSFDAQGPEGLLAVTEQECLVFMQRGGL